MSQTNLSERIDYSAFQTGNGADNYRLTFPAIFKRARVSTYGTLIDYLNEHGGLEQRTAYSRRENVPSSFLSFQKFGPKRAIALMEHLKQKGLISLIKKTGSKPSKSKK